jgi:hypothetical protein
MNILSIAIQEAGNVTKLAETLGVVPSAIGNWKSRGLPKSWQLALELKYRKALLQATRNPKLVNLQLNAVPTSENPA